MVRRRGAAAARAVPPPWTETLELLPSDKLRHYSGGAALAIDYHL